MHPAPPTDLAACLHWFRDRWEIDAPGLDAATLDAIEARERVRLPRDARLLLTTLPAGRLGRTNLHLEDWTSPGLVDRVQARLREGLECHVRGGSLWHADWGDPHPDRVDAALAELHTRLAAAPRLLPLLGRLIPEPSPDAPGEPPPAILSVYDADAIVYARDLRTALLASLNLLRHPATLDGVDWDRVHALPFWGELLREDDTGWTLGVSAWEG